MDQTTYQVKLRDAVNSICTYINEFNQSWRNWEVVNDASPQSFESWEFHTGYRVQKNREQDPITYYAPFEDLRIGDLVYRIAQPFETFNPDDALNVKLSKFIKTALPNLISYNFKYTKYLDGEIGISFEKQADMLKQGTTQPFNLIFFAPVQNIQRNLPAGIYYIGRSVKDKEDLKDFKEGMPIISDIYRDNPTTRSYDEIITRQQIQYTTTKVRSEEKLVRINYWRVFTYNLLSTDMWTIWR